MQRSQPWCVLFCQVASLVPPSPAGRRQAAPHNLGHLCSGFRLGSPGQGGWFGRWSGPGTLYAAVFIVRGGSCRLLLDTGASCPAPTNRLCSLHLPALLHCNWREAALWLCIPKQMQAWMLPCGAGLALWRFFANDSLVSPQAPAADAPAVGHPSSLPALHCSPCFVQRRKRLAVGRP